MVWRPPPDAPELEISRLERYEPDDGNVPEVCLSMEETKSDDVEPVAGPPLPELRHVTLLGREAGATFGPSVLVVPRRPYRQVLTILSPHDVATIQVSYDDGFKEPDYGSLSFATLQIPIFPGQALFMRQNSEFDLDVSYGVEPRGVGR